MHSTGNSQYYCNNFVWRHKVTRHHGDNFITYVNVKPLYSPPETNIIMCVNHFSIKKKNAVGEGMNSVSSLSK